MRDLPDEEAELSPKSQGSPEVKTWATGGLIRPTKGKAQAGKALKSRLRAYREVFERPLFWFMQVVWVEDKCCTQLVVLK